MLQTFEFITDIEEVFTCIDILLFQLFCQISLVLNLIIFIFLKCRWCFHIKISKTENIALNIWNWFRTRRYIDLAFIRWCLIIKNWNFLTKIVFGDFEILIDIQIRSVGVIQWNIIQCLEMFFYSLSRITLHFLNCLQPFLLQIKGDEFRIFLVSHINHFVLGYLVMGFCVPFSECVFLLWAQWS